jgi:hypothetical protein
MTKLTDREPQACVNTDRELYRDAPEDFYTDSLHVTINGGIGINCGGLVFVKTLREWHRLAKADAAPDLPAREWTDAEVMRGALERVIGMCGDRDRCLCGRPTGIPAVVAAARAGLAAAAPAKEPAFKIDIISNGSGGTLPDQPAASDAVTDPCTQAAQIAASEARMAAADPDVAALVARLQSYASGIPPLIHRLANVRTVTVGDLNEAASCIESLARERDESHERGARLANWLTEAEAERDKLRELLREADAGHWTASEIVAAIRAALKGEA